jgi:hypothetical protein
MHQHKWKVHVDQHKWKVHVDQHKWKVHVDQHKWKVHVDQHFSSPAVLLAMSGHGHKYIPWHCMAAHAYILYNHQTAYIYIYCTTTTLVYWYRWWKGILHFCDAGLTSAPHESQAHSHLCRTRAQCMAYIVFISDTSSPQQGQITDWKRPVGRAMA